MVIENITGVLSAVVGTVGFCLVLRVRKHRLPIIALSTALCYSIYLLSLFLTKNDIISIYISSLCAAIASEVFARLFKAPVTVFIIPTILPLVPGAGLFYTISTFFKGELREALGYFATTGKTIGAILLGIITVSTFVKCMKNHNRWKMGDPTLKYRSNMKKEM